MSHKIKLNLNKSSKALEDLPNQKISINLGVSSKKIDIPAKKELPNKVNKNIIRNKPVIYDNQLFKQFKKSEFRKIDLHGLTVDEAHQKLIEYFKDCYSKKKLLHIVITGLGNKSDDKNFFTGKIRKIFPVWLETSIFQKYVKSYSSCKINHGGLGAYYVKLKIKE